MSVLNLPLGVVMKMEGGLKGNSEGNTSLPLKMGLTQSNHWNFWDVLGKIVKAQSIFMPKYTPHFFHPKVSKWPSTEDVDFWSV